MRVLRGKVVSGIGNFSYWIEKLQDHYYRKTGMKFFPGTLNVELDQTYRVPQGAIRLEKEEYGGSVSVNIVPCRIFRREAYILRTDKSEDEQGQGGRSIIEVASEVKLRAEYGLEDGDEVEVEVEE